MTEHSSAPQLYCWTLPYLTHLAFPSGLCSLQLCSQGGCPLPPHQKCTTLPVFPTFFPRVSMGEPQADEPSRPCSSSSLCSALQVGGGGSGASPSRRPQLSSAGPPPLGRKVLLLQLSSSKETLQEAHPQGDRARHRCVLLPSLRRPPLPHCSLPVFHSFWREWEFVKGGNYLLKLSLANDTMTQEILKH